MEPFFISKQATRRFVLGKQGLWPGRRWAGLDGAAEAARACEAVQLDPLNVIARSHDLTLHSRVANYRPEYLDHLLYQRREFFDYGGALFFYPMAELPYWRLHMRRRAEEGRWADFIAAHPDLIAQVKNDLQTRGPLGNRDFNGNHRVDSYRGRKDTSLALFALWITGELMIHHRRNFQRVYDFRENVAPPDLDYTVADEVAEQFFARKSVAFLGLVRELEWKNSLSGYTLQNLGLAEARAGLERLCAEKVLAAVQVEGDKERRFVLQTDLPLLEILESGGVPEEWRPLETTTQEEVTFLAPLDIVSARGRAAWLFDFDYKWEVYKPVHQRRWGYYTLPVLYGDRLVARFDSRLDRQAKKLDLLGFWLEDAFPVDTAFAAALLAGFRRFLNFLEAGHLACQEGVPGPIVQLLKPLT